MHGNVWEWCQDYRHKDYDGAPKDGSAWMTGNDSYRVLRGGSWGDNPEDCRSARRNYNSHGFRNYDIGFREVCSAPRSLQ